MAELLSLHVKEGAETPYHGPSVEGGRIGVGRRAGAGEVAIDFKCSRLPSKLASRPLACPPQFLYLLPAIDSTSFMTSSVCPLGFNPRLNK